MWKGLAAAIFAMLLFAAPALALEPIGPNEVNLYVEAGQEQRVDLTFLASSGDIGKLVVAKGEVDDWFRFGPTKDTSYIFSSLGTVIVPLVITAPESAGIAEHEIGLFFDGEKFFTINLNVVLSPDEITALQDKASLYDNMEALKQEINEEMGNVQTGIQAHIDTKIGEVNQGNKNIQSQLTDTQEKINKIEEQSASVTGNYLAAGSPIYFVVGFVIGAGALYFYFRRKTGSGVKINRAQQL